MLHQAHTNGAGECPHGGRPRGLQARLLHACLLSAAALSGVDAQFASPDANCSFASFATRLQAREAFTIPSLAAAYAAAPLERSTPLKSRTLAIAAGRQRIISPHLLQFLNVNFRAPPPFPLLTIWRPPVSIHPAGHVQGLLPEAAVVRRALAAKSVRHAVRTGLRAHVPGLPAHD